MTKVEFCHFCQAASGGVKRRRGTTDILSWRELPYARWIETDRNEMELALTNGMPTAEYGVVPSFDLL